MSWLITAHQHVRVPEGTDSECMNVLSSLQGHTGAAEPGLHSEHSGPCLGSSATKLFLEEGLDFLL